MNSENKIIFSNFTLICSQKPFYTNTFTVIIYLENIKSCLCYSLISTNTSHFIAVNSYWMLSYNLHVILYIQAIKIWKCFQCIINKNLSFTNILYCMNGQTEIWNYKVPTQRHLFKYDIWLISVYSLGPKILVKS